MLNNVLGAGFDGKYLLLEDNCYGIFVYAIDEKKLVCGRRFSKEKNYHHIYSKAPSCSDHGDFILPKSNKIGFGLYKVVDEKILTIDSKIKWHKASISCSAFSKDGSFFATGGEDGRLYVFNTKDAKFYAMCPIQADYIACIVFDSKSNFLAFGTYDCKLLIYDLKTFEFVVELKTFGVLVDMFFYDNDEKLFYITKDGESGIYDLLLKNNHLNKHYDIWLHQCVLAPNKNYAYIVGRENKLYIHNLQNNEKFIEIELEESGVSFIKIAGNYLCLGFVSGRMIFIDQEYQKEYFLELLKNKNFEEAKIFAQEKNIFLKLQDFYVQVRSKNWEEVLEDVIKLLNTDQTDAALHIAGPYLEDEAIQREFRSYVNKKQLLRDFLEAIENGNYQKAYKIANEKSSLKNLKAFSELERYFEKLLEASKKILEENYGHQIYRIKKLFEPFLQIPEKKERIEIVFNHFAQYSTMMQALRDQDYKEAYEIVQKYPFLNVTKAYAKVLNYYKELLAQVQDEILLGMNEEIEEKIALLSAIPLFKKEVENLGKFREMQEKMDVFFREKKYQECYGLLDQCPELASCEVYFKMEEYFLNLFKGVTDLAQLGKTQEVYEQLSEFFVLEKWKKRMDAIFQIAYFYEIKDADHEDKSINWSATLRAYLGYFHQSSELEELCAMKGLGHLLDSLGDVKKVELAYQKSILVR